MRVDRPTRSRQAEPAGRGTGTLRMRVPAKALHSLGVFRYTLAAMDQEV
jgi:hypothetical protein